MPKMQENIYQNHPNWKARKRVAAYARVSSGKDAMLHSLSAQVSYYNALSRTTTTGRLSVCTPMKP